MHPLTKVQSRNSVDSRNKSFWNTSGILNVCNFRAAPPVITLPFVLEVTRVAQYGISSRGYSSRSSPPA